MENRNKNNFKTSDELFIEVVRILGTKRRVVHLLCGIADLFTFPSISRSLNRTSSLKHHRPIMMITVIVSINLLSSHRSHKKN